MRRGVVLETGVLAAGAVTAAFTVGAALLLLTGPEPAGAQTNCVPGGDPGGDPVPSLTLLGLIALIALMAGVGRWSLTTRRTTTSPTALIIVLGTASMAFVPVMGSDSAAAQTTTFPCPTTTLPPTTVPPTTVPPTTQVEGVGVASGSAVFAAPGVPPLGASCAATDLDLEVAVDSVVVSTAETFFAGPLDLQGTGESACDTFATGSGSVTGSVAGEAPNGATLSCTTLEGAYSRVGYVLTATLDGECELKGMPQALRFRLHGVLVPDPLTAGVFAPLVTADLRGDLTVSSA